MRLQDVRSVEELVELATPLAQNPGCVGLSLAS